ncbi:TetR/AcrR family transcriptional regulator C-terminal domain-containing protein [Kibdelosporangium phytohabitans]|uniref:GntR family transcriptional regulator n=1 Tax=Kibdelosporangium phytohabitans TaxID=860235 RepID=A0A0N9HLU3_9PSEU|nr:TetR/AcrR family transcriptional regulator C-terminal domain-containing protein [Kibdelosporangium phytohabitans]ALG07388.1 GntR family transcriptional regulator [Kibdelosporangium phytohabitans]MBE1471730.1 DNA-binding transcriptional regulator YhcF (GntR family) [Kibdelosporangium phytohabitans]
MSTEAPYLRIAAEIKARVARGELRPGDRVPSTREITRQWGVAMATATKVIAVLRDDGVVDTKPGAGTVVRSAAAPRKAAKERDLGRGAVIRAAIVIADAEGLQAVSMRRVAMDLGVATMSLYRHVPSKDDLVVEMADAAFGERPFPERIPGDWRAAMEIAARLMWTVCRRHPWIAEAMSMTRPRVSPNLIMYTEWVFTVLRRFGLSMDDMMYTHLSVFGHVRGLALTLQDETRARQDSGVTHDEWIVTQEEALGQLLATGRYPTMAEIITDEFDYDLDKVFEYGLRLLLDGVQRRLRTRELH